MEFEAAPIIKYIYNQTGEIGGYPMVDILHKEFDKNQILGSKTTQNEFGIKKFENLVIPVGLVSFSDDYYSNKTGGSQHKTNIKVKHHDTVNNELFNKVFDLITKCPKNRSKQQTKKNIFKIRNAITKKYKKTKP
jgi:hypothetical protein